jgi:hypothetical protein
MAIVDVIMIHGIGDLRKKGQSYSAPLQASIRKHFGSDDRDVLAFHEVDWSDIGAKKAEQLIRKKGALPDATLPTAGARWPIQDAIGEVLDATLNVSEQVRRFLLTGVGDVLIYFTDVGGAQIRQRLIEKILEVRRTKLEQQPEAEQHYVTLVAHSLGSVIAYDVCRMLGGELSHAVAGLGLSNFFTLGSPLALFSLLEYGGEDVHYARRGVHLDRAGGVWLNFYDQQDPISFPLAGVYPPLPDVPGRNYTIRDIRVQTGTFHAHTRYFLNDTIAKHIAQQLRRDYALDR